jgi:putative oxidoreductase
MSQQSTAPNPSTNPSRLPFDVTAAHHQDALLLLGRVALGAIFVTSGLHKLIDLNGFIANLAGKGVPYAAVFAPLGAVVEFFGGLAIVLGLAFRASALLMLVFVVVATAISHRYWEFEGALRVPQQVNFEKNLCIGGGFIVLFAAGAGRLSLDGLLRAVRTAN